MAGTTQSKKVPQHGTQEAAVRKLSKAWSAAVNAKDVDGIMDLVTDDVVFAPRDAPPVVGKTAVEELYQRLFSGFDLEQSLEIEDIYVAGDWAFIWGTVSVDIVPVSGGQRKQTKILGMTIARRQPDGSWKISHGINNMIG